MKFKIIILLTVLLLIGCNQDNSYPVDNTLLGQEINRSAKKQEPVKKGTAIKDYGLVVDVKYVEGDRYLVICNHYVFLTRHTAEDIPLGVICKCVTLSDGEKVYQFSDGTSVSGGGKYNKIKMDYSSNSRTESDLDRLKKLNRELEKPDRRLGR